MSLGLLQAHRIVAESVSTAGWQRIDEGKVEVFAGAEHRVAFDRAVVTPKTTARLRLVAGALVLPMTDAVPVRVEPDKAYPGRAEAVITAPKTEKPQKVLLEVLEPGADGKAAVLARVLVCVMPRDVLAQGWRDRPVWISGSVASLDSECRVQKLNPGRLAADAVDSLPKQAGLFAVALAETAQLPASLAGGQTLLCFTSGGAVPLLLESRPCGSGWLVLADRRLLDMLPASPGVQAALVRACNAGASAALPP